MRNFNLYNKDKALVGVLSLSENAYTDLQEPGDQELMFTDRERGLEFILIRVETRERT